MEYFFKSLNQVLYSILKAHGFIIVILIVTFLLEQLLGLRLFMRQFRWKKNDKMGIIMLDGDSVTYFIFICGVLIYDLYKKNIEFNIVSILVGLVIIIIFTIIFRDLYDKYQGKDPNKADDDYT